MNFIDREWNVERNAIVAGNMTDEPLAQLVEMIEKPHPARAGVVVRIVDRQRKAFGHIGQF